mmetsp:Transcript_32814/g.36737  ORF Transcript_32814/g.36737 Transcript_32814/m.36737 type:complete len:111 (+) Transcript_32814:2881-3213(+)
MTTGRLNTARIRYPPDQQSPTNVVPIAISEDNPNRKIGTLKRVLITLIESCFVSPVVSPASTGKFKNRKRIIWKQRANAYPNMRREIRVYANRSERKPKLVQSIRFTVTV